MLWIGSKEARSASGKIGKRGAHALSVLARGMHWTRDSGISGFGAQKAAHTRAGITGALALTIDVGQDNSAGPDTFPGRARSTLADARLCLVHILARDFLALNKTPL